MSLAVRLRRWDDGDLPLLRAKNAPAMTEHLGGPETERKLLKRHRRYVDLVANGAGHMFVILVGPSEAAAGSVGYWPTRWRDEDVVETGWAVLGEFQGQGIATGAVRLVAAHAAEHAGRDAMDAFPSVDNAASNAVCRKVGFAFVGPCEVEYPKGRMMQANDWRLGLRSLSSPPAAEV